MTCQATQRGPNEVSQPSQFKTAVLSNQSPTVFFFHHFLIISICMLQLPKISQTIWCHIFCRLGNWKSHVCLAHKRRDCCITDRPLTIFQLALIHILCHKQKWIQIAGKHVTWASHGFRYQVISLLSIYNHTCQHSLTKLRTQAPLLSAGRLAPGQKHSVNTHIVI